MHHPAIAKTLRKGTTMRKYIIWSNKIDMDDWREDLEAEYPGRSEDELYKITCDINAEYLDDERMNLNITLSVPIICIADLGLWNGRRQAYKLIGSGNISDCLRYGHDYVEWYVDSDGEFRCEDTHHDGTNCYRYRALTGNADLITELLCNGKATEEDIERHTKRIGPIIGDVYGWQFRDRAASDLLTG